MESGTLDSRSKFATFILLFCLFLSVYTLTFNGAFRQDDEHILAARTQSLALWGQLVEPQVYGNQRVQALIPLGDAATQIEFGQAILGAILIRIAQALGLGGAQSLFSLNIFLTALCGGLVYLIVMQLNYSRRVAIWCALFFGVGSMAWPYALTYFRDTLAMTMSAMVFLGWARLLREGHEGRRSAYVLIFLGLLGGVLGKNNVAALAVAVGAVSFMRWLRLPKTHKESITGVITGFVFGLCVIGIMLLLPDDGPLARFSLDYYGYLAQHFWGSIHADLLAAIAGPFISPGKSIFLFSPPLCLGLISIRHFLKMKERDYILLAILFALFLAAAQGLFYREAWSGGFGWGLKYMLPILPALIPLLAPGIESLLEGNNLKGKSWLGCVLALSVLVQLGAALVPWNQVYFQWQSQGLDPYAPGAAWDGRLLAIPFQLSKLISIDQWAVAWRRLISTRLPGVTFVVLFTLTLAVLAVRELFRTSRFSQLKMRSLIGTSLIVFCLLSCLTWWAVRGDPAWGDNRPEFHAALAKVLDEISGQDVVLVDSYGTTLWYFWINRWNRPQRWYSLPFSIQGSSPAADNEPSPAAELECLIKNLKENVDSIWYVTSGETADYDENPDREWLKRVLSLGSCLEFKAGSTVEVCKYTYSK